MSNNMNIDYYDLIYSEDDGGWYYQLFTYDGSHVADKYTSNLFTTQSQATADIEEKYPTARLLKVFQP